MSESHKTDWNKVGALAGVVAAIVAIITLAVMVWPLLFPSTRSLMSYEGNLMTTWLPPALIGVCVLLAAIFHFGAAYISRDKNDKKEEGSARKQHEACEIEANNLRSQVRRLQERDQTSGVQISARNGQIEQLQATLEEVQWLTDIATEEAEKINRFVSITDCGIGQHEFFRSDPYLDFSITVSNRSVFDIALPEIGVSSHSIRES